MSTIIEKLGQYADEHLAAQPLKVRRLLKAAYRVSGWQMRWWPEKGLSPSQADLAVICNQLIQEGLRHPQQSAIVNVFFPCSWLHALGLKPQFTEGLSGYLNGAGCDHAFINYAEQAGVPKSLCSYHKLLLGACLSDFLPRPLAVLNTTLACDANALTFRQVAEHYQVPQFVLDVPNEQTAETRAYVADQLMGLPKFLFQVTGQKTVRPRLLEQVRRENQCLQLYKEYLSWLAVRELPSHFTSEMYRVFLTHVLWGTPQTLAYFQTLVQEARTAAPVRDKVRVLWVHALPNWQRSLSLKFKNSDRYQLLACDLNYDNLSYLGEQDIYGSWADKLLANSLGGPVSRRLGRIEELVQKLHADGVIYFCHWGCKNTLGGAQQIKSGLSVPTLLLDGDGVERGNVNDGQMVTKVEAFLEMLEGRC